MGPSLFNNFSDGPAMVLPPPQVHPCVQFSSDAMSDISVGRLRSFSTDPTAFPTNDAQSESPKSYISHSTSWTSAPSSVPIVTNPSRKRSRDESIPPNNHTNSETDSLHLTSHTVSSPKPVPEELPTYGKGMTLLNPRNGVVISRESQTGTWFEEIVETATAATPPIAVPVGRVNGSGLPSRKSQRLDKSAPGSDDTSLAAINCMPRPSTQDDIHYSNISISSSSSSLENPLVDDFTHLLGISWQRIASDDEDMTAAVRGWEKYIDNHYSRHMHEAQILLKNRGLNAFLVAGCPTASRTPHINQPTSRDSLCNNDANSQTQPAFFLFDEDLSKARLVGRDWETCLRNLRSIPVIFEGGTEVLTAAERKTERMVEDKGILIGNVCEDANGDTVAEGEGEAGIGMAMGMDIDYE